LGLEPPKPEASAPAAAAPGGYAPPESATPADLPDFAKKAYDLDQIKKAVDDAASVGGGLWLSYLFVLFYLAIAAGAVTHADLFLENPVKLPFLNVELPLLAFSFLAPILFLFVHAYTLVHLVFLTDKAKRFDQALSTQIGDDSAAAKDADDPRVAAIAGVRGQLPSNIFIQFLAGPRDRRAGSFGWLLRAIAWSTLAIAPILLLLLFQLQFLPFHLSWITWTHRVALVADLVLIWWLWRKILLGRDSAAPRPRAGWAWRAIGILLTVCALLFSWGLATFPGEWQTEHLAAWRPIRERDEAQRPIIVSIHDWVFESKIDSINRRRRWPVSSTLVLTGFNIYEGLNIDDPDKVKGRDFVFRARGRDLKGAIFDFATLPKVDFTGAELEGARLNSAQLDRASFDAARLQGASLVGAQLKGASFGCEQPEDSEFKCVQLQGALLNRAQLQGASLDFAQLQGAFLSGAQLQGASLFNADLSGAQLSEDSGGALGLQSFKERRSLLRNSRAHRSLVWNSRARRLMRLSSKVRHSRRLRFREPLCSRQTCWRRIFRKRCFGERIRRSETATLHQTCQRQSDLPIRPATGDRCGRMNLGK
jgi:Pentapeptide repeats (8 copies)